MQANSLHLLGLHAAIVLMPLTMRWCKLQGEEEVPAYQPPSGRHSQAGLSKTTPGSQHRAQRTGRWRS